jgi:hypothetical protein
MTDGKGRGWYGDEEGHREAAKQAQQESQSRLRDFTTQTWTLLVFMVALPFRGLAVLVKQARGTWQNTERGWDYLTFDNMLPPSIVGTIQWFIETIPKLFGLRDTKPWQQVGAALSLIGFALLATFLSGGWLIGTVVIVAALGSFGIVRFVPAVNDRWQAWRAALPVKDDYDVARWKRD